MAETNNLFLNGIFDEGRISPSTVIIRYPKHGYSTRQSLNGLLVSEPTLTSQNKWGPILNDVSNIQDVASLLGSSEMWSWIGASVMCWKGTEPIKTNVEFYLINYKRGLNLGEKLKDLQYLTSLYDIGKNIAVEVHGGYAARVLETNGSHFDNGARKSKDPRVLLRGYEPARDAAGIINDENWTNMETGTIEVQFGNKMSVRKMLIQRMSVTPSLVEVAEKGGNNPKPLYYKVSLDLIGSRPLLSSDVDRMYKI